MSNWIERVGKCPYCEQHIMVRVEPEAEQSVIDKEAVKMCNCEEARRQQAIETSIATAESVIKTEYAGNPSVQKVLMAAVNAIGYGTIDKITLTAGDTRYQMQKTKEGIRNIKTTTCKEVNES